MILADDLGWRDVGYQGSEIARPNIDSTASEDSELGCSYAQPSCSPTRTALMTGKSPLRLGIDRPISKNEQTGLPLDETILPEYFARLGYRPLPVRGPEFFAGSVLDGASDNRLLPKGQGSIGERGATVPAAVRVDRVGTRASAAKRT